MLGAWSTAKFIEAFALFLIFCHKYLSFTSSFSCFLKSVTDKRKQVLIYGLLPSTGTV